MTKPIAQITFSVDIEIEYDPFQGRTAKEFAEIVHDDLIDSLWEMRNGTVQGLFTDVKSVEVIGEWWTLPTFRAGMLLSNSKE